LVENKFKKQLCNLFCYKNGSRVGLIKIKEKRSQILKKIKANIYLEPNSIINVIDGDIETKESIKLKNSII